jgi:hypothetical protein
MYKVYIISLKDSGTGIYQQSANHILPHTLSCCNMHGWQYEIFTAINGFSIQESVWTNLGLLVPKIKPKKFGGKPGAQGCFLSHYLLWQKCIDLNEPIVVLEDDAEVIAPLLEFNTDYDLIKLHAPTKINRHPTLGNWGAGAFAYWLSPIGARKMIEFSKTNGARYTDKAIGSSVLNWAHIPEPIVRLGPRIGSSTNPEKYPISICY